MATNGLYKIRMCLCVCVGKGQILALEPVFIDFCHIQVYFLYNCELISFLGIGATLRWYIVMLCEIVLQTFSNSFCKTIANPHIGITILQSSCACIIFLFFTKTSK